MISLTGHNNLTSASSLCGKDYKLCPFHTPHWILKKFPKTAMVLGKHDVLKDDGILFYEKLNKSNNNTELRVYNDSIHSFWPSGMSHTESYKKASVYMQEQIFFMVKYQLIEDENISLVIE